MDPFLIEVCMATWNICRKLCQFIDHSFTPKFIVWPINSSLQCACTRLGMLLHQKAKYSWHWRCFKASSISSFSISIIRDTGYVNLAMIIWKSCQFHSILQYGVILKCHLSVHAPRIGFVHHSVSLTSFLYYVFLQCVASHPDTRMPFVNGNDCYHAYDKNMNTLMMVYFKEYVPIITNFLLFKSYTWF